MPCLHWRLHWKLHLISSQTGTKIKLTLALGPMFSVTLIVMLLLCKMLSNVPFLFLYHIMLDWNVANKSLLLRFVQVYMLYSLILVCFVWSMLTYFVSLQIIIINGIYWNLVPKNRDYKDSYNSVSSKSISSANVNSKTIY